MHKTFDDTKFSISESAFEHLCVQAQKAGDSPFRYFKRQAGRLALQHYAAFDVPGTPMDRSISVRIHPATLERLKALCNNLGVPHEGIGEMICTWERT